MTRLSSPNPLSGGRVGVRVELLLDAGHEVVAETAHEPPPLLRRALRVRLAVLPARGAVRAEVGVQRVSPRVHLLLRRLVVVDAQVLGEPVHDGEADGHGAARDELHDAPVHEGDDKDAQRRDAGAEAQPRGVHAAVQRRDPPLRLLEVRGVVGERELRGEVRPVEALRVVTVELDGVHVPLPEQPAQDRGLRRAEAPPEREEEAVVDVRAEVVRRRADDLLPRAEGVPVDEQGRPHHPVKVLPAPRDVDRPVADEEGDPAGRQHARKEVLPVAILGDDLAFRERPAPLHLRHEQQQPAGAHLSTAPSEGGPTISNPGYDILHLECNILYLDCRMPLAAKLQHLCHWRHGGKVAAELGGTVAAWRQSGGKAGGKVAAWLHGGKASGKTGGKVVAWRQSYGKTGGTATVQFRSVSSVQSTGGGGKAGGKVAAKLRHIGSKVAAKRRHISGTVVAWRQSGDMAAWRQSGSKIDRKAGGMGAWQHGGKTGGKTWRQGGMAAKRWHREP
eukprot:gene2746-biopygen6942